MPKLGMCSEAWLYMGEERLEQGGPNSWQGKGGSALGAGREAVLE